MLQGFVLALVTLYIKVQLDLHWSVWGGFALCAIIDVCVAAANQKQRELHHRWARERHELARASRDLLGGLYGLVRGAPKP